MIDVYVFIFFLSQGIILVYDITNPDSFSRLTYWMDSIQKVSIWIPHVHIRCTCTESVCIHYMQYESLSRSTSAASR